MICNSAPRAAVGFVLVLLAGCGGGGSGLTPGGPDPSGAERRVGNSGRTLFVPARLAFPARGPRRNLADTSLAFPQLNFVRPVQLTHAKDGTDRVFVVEQDGRILVLPNRDDVQQAKVFLDLSATVQRGDEEEGLLGLAFAPDYKTSGRFYVHYTQPSPNQSVLAQFTVSAADPDRADPASQLVVLKVAQPFRNHRGSNPVFGSDGMLYLGFGDGGSAGDPHNLAQDLTSLLGKVLRLDVKQASVQQPYAIPNDNPFVGQGGGVRGEIWALGLRNPWRIAFDATRGKLWAGDVGQYTREEIDLVARAGNYGWSVFEGTRQYKTTNPGPGPLLPPLLEYGGTLGRCVIGGEVYTGTRIPQLRDHYVFGDFWTGRVLAQTEAGGSVTSLREVASVPDLCSFGCDEHGELFALALTGRILRLRVAAATVDPDLFPRKLSATGIFRDLQTLVPAEGVLPFAVNAELWSDGASKRRWIAPVGRGSIRFHPTDAWDFALGTVLVKHFEMELEVGNPKSTRRLETRVLVHEADGWAGYTYRWNQSQTDADLLLDQAHETLMVRDPRDKNSVGVQTWTYPGPRECMLCHTDSGGPVLGPRTLQLNRLVDFEGTPRNQLELLDELGLFTAPIGAPGSYGAYPDPADTRAPLDLRARAYLAANCAMCHNPAAGAVSTLDLRYTTPEARMNALGVRPVHSTLGLPDAMLVKPKVPGSSVLWERMRREGEERMPALGTHVPDALGVDLVRRWIETR